MNSSSLQKEARAPLLHLHGLARIVPLAYLWLLLLLQGEETPVLERERGGKGDGGGGSDVQGSDRRVRED